MLSDWLLLLGAAGLTLVLTDGAIFAGLRRLLRRVPFVGPVVCCSHCAGVWIGLGIGWTAHRGEALPTRLLAASILAGATSLVALGARKLIWRDAPKPECEKPKEGTGS